MTEHKVFCVVVEHNVVQAIERHDGVADGIDIPQTNLEAGTRLARNHRENGCIDGRYYFDRAERARVFALLCLEFMKGLVQKRIEALEKLAPGSEFVPEQTEPPGPAH